MKMNHHAYLTDDQRSELSQHYRDIAKKCHGNDRYGEFKALDRTLEVESHKGIWLSADECRIAGVVLEPVTA
jgi:hypothetical protein